MDPGFLLIENFGRFVAIVGLLLAAPLFAWAGWMWMSSMGDPNRSAAARNSVVCVCVGVLIVGGAFIIPGVVSDMVVEPVGGITFDLEGGVNCDQILRDHLLVNREASNAHRINFVVKQVQAKFEDCRLETWNPSARVQTSGPASRSDFPGCYQVSGGDVFVGGILVPPGLPGSGGRSASSAVDWSGRDAYNNIIVHWSRFIAGGSEPGLPSDGAICWMYVNALGSWLEGY